MYNLTLIAACDSKGCIGRDNKLPWKCPSEMDYFKTRIAFRPIIMGKNTCLSLKRPLNSAPNYVLTRDCDFKREGFITVNSMEEMFEIMGKKPSEYYVAGGSQIYRQFLEMERDRDDINIIVELSVLHTVVPDGDSYFPLDLLKGNADYREQIIYKHINNDMKWHVSAYYKRNK